MHKVAICAVALAASVFAGCRSVEVESFGQDYVRDSAGGAVLVDGKPIVFSKGWSVDHFQHWMITKADEMRATVSPDSIEFVLGGLNSSPDSDGLAKVVEKSLAGVSKLAAKISAAVMSSGGSIGAEAVANYVKKFVAKGGDVSKASVTITDGVLTCTDGSCSVSGACSECPSGD